MSEKHLTATLAQMMAAVRNMRAFTDGMAFEQYQADPKTRFAVERCVELVSEAARRLPDEVLESHPEIPWEDIKGIGNILRHGYDRVDDRIIWTALERHLTPVETALGQIATEHKIDIGSIGRDGASKGE